MSKPAQRVLIAEKPAIVSLKLAVFPGRITLLFSDSKRNNLHQHLSSIKEAVICKRPFSLCCPGIFYNIINHCLSDTSGKGIN